LSSRIWIDQDIDLQGTPCVLLPMNHNYSTPGPSNLQFP
jgi:hypothetical protein